MIRAAVVDRPVNITELTAEVASPGNGAVAAFLGTVRSNNDGKPVSGIDYSAYREMAELEMAAILGEAEARHEFAGAAIEHRIGTLAIGDVSIGVAVASPHRRAALDALDYIVEEVKRRVPVWKLEHYEDGTREWVGAAVAAGK